MTRGRKAQEAPITPIAVNEAAIAQDMAASAQLPAMELAIAEHQGAILAQYGDGLPYERLRYVDKCRYHMARSAEEALEVGRCLIVMKECEGHGDWLPLLEDVGIERTAAARLMQVAVKFSNVATSQHLIDAAKSKSKLLELMILDDEEMAALNEGESVRGLQLDDVERMSVSELRRALRQAREDKEAAVADVQSSVSASLAAKDKVIADKSKRIAELVEEKNKRETFTTDERAQELEQQLNQRVLTSIGSLKPVRQVINEFVALPDVGNGHHFAMSAALDRIIAEVMAIASDYGIQLAVINEFSEGFSDPNAGEDFPLGAGPDGE